MSVCYVDQDLQSHCLLQGNLARALANPASCWYDIPIKMMVTKSEVLVHLHSTAAFSQEQWIDETVLETFMSTNIGESIESPM